MNLNTLSERARAGEALELELLSLEGGIYLLRVQSAQGVHHLLDERGRVMHLRSSTHLRDLLDEHQVPALPCVLLQHVAHDEMCGRGAGPVEPLRLPLNLQRQW